MPVGHSRPVATRKTALRKASGLAKATALVADAQDRLKREKLKLLEDALKKWLDKQSTEHTNDLYNEACRYFDRKPYLYD